MYKCSEDIIDLFRNHYRQVVRATFKGKFDTFVIDESEIIQGGLTTDRYSVSGTKIELGSAIAAELTMKLKNYDGKYDDVVFEGAELFIEVGIKKWDAHRWENAQVEYIPCGYYIIDTPPRTLSTISISALDRMVLFDKPVNWSKVKFPITVGELIKTVSNICGVTLGTNVDTLVNHSYKINAVPEQTSDLTWRTIIQWCAFLTATCAYMDYNGELIFKWYEQSDFSVTPSERYRSDMYENDITITGIVYTASDSSVYVTGSTDYALNFNACNILQNDIESVLSNIYYAIRGFTYRPYEATIKPAPFLYPMDIIKYTDSKGIEHDTIVTHVTYTVNSNTTIAGSGETSTSNAYVSTSGLTTQQSQAIQDMKNSIEVTISTQELAGLNVSQTIANAMGYNLTILTPNDDSGKQFYYIHNAVTLAASNSIYTIASGHIAWTDDWNDGNPHWTTTITHDNNIILKVLGQYKLSGNNIEDGAIKENHLDSAYTNKVELAIGTAKSNAVDTAKDYTDTQMDDAKEYIDDEVAGAKTYSDSQLEKAKEYSDTQMDEAKEYVDTGIAGSKEYADKLSNAIIEKLNNYMVRSDIIALAKTIFIEGADGKEYAGKLRVVNGKPVFEYDTTEGGKTDGTDY